MHELSVEWYFPFMDFPDSVLTVVLVEKWEVIFPQIKN